MKRNVKLSKKTGIAQNFIYLLVCIFFSLFILSGIVSCSSDSSESSNSPNDENNTALTGKISGTVTFKNLDAEANGGIIVTLDKIDELGTAEFVSSVTAKIEPESARAIAGTTATSNTGTYFFENLAPGTYTVYAASSYSSEKAVFTNVLVRSAETTVVDTLNLTATGSISGKITLDSGTTGNTGILVFVAGTSFMAMTDDAGNYTISDIPAGSGYQLVISKNGVTLTLNSDVSVNANDSTKIDDFNFASTIFISTTNASDTTAGNFSTYYIAGTSVTNPTVTAKWDFTGFTSGDIPSNTDLGTNTDAIKKIDAKKTGKGAALDMSGCLGNSSENVLIINTMSKASLSDLEPGRKFTLTIDDATNLVIQADGFGPVASNRYLAFANQAGTILVAKDNMYENKKINFVVPGIPAGTYTVYCSGIKIYSIDCSVAAYNLPAVPTDVTSIAFSEDGSTLITELSGEAIMDVLTVKALNGDKDENNEYEDLTNDVVWESSDTTVATVNYGVIALKSEGTAVISARIGNVIAALPVTVTPCTKTIVTFIDSEKLPAKEEKIDLENLSDNVKVALTATILGSEVLTVSQATLTRGAALEPYTNSDGEVVNPINDLTLGKAGDENTNSFKYGLYWKDNAAALNSVYATIKCTVTPASGKTLKLIKTQAQSYNGRGTSHIGFTPTVGNVTGNAIPTTKAWSIDSAEQDITINSETEITFTVKKTSAVGDGTSFGMQDLQLIFEESN